MAHTLVIYRPDTRSVLWNEISVDLAREDLTKAALAINGCDGVELDTLVCSGRHVSDGLVQEAIDRGADELMLADPRASGLGRLERRRLRHRCPVPLRG